jgi:hypothetical protein
MILEPYRRKTDVPINTKEPYGQNINTLNYWYGWLSSDEKFNIIREKIMSAKIEVGDIFEIILKEGKESSHRKGLLLGP